MKHLLFCCAIFLVCGTNAALAQSVRLKDLVNFEGVRGNDLVGYGLVVGLNGSGDGFRNAPFTKETLSNLLETLGANVSSVNYRAKNVAAVLATAKLPAFARVGSTIDVSVSAIGDATSLLGGTLVLTPLKAQNGHIYAVAQGSIIAGGVVAKGDASQIVQGVPTSGSIPAGAIVEREVDFRFNQMETINLSLKNPDFSTAAKISNSINSTLGISAATLVDAGTVTLNFTQHDNFSPAETLARIENISLFPDSPSRVVVDQRSGTIVMGQSVKISRVAVSQGNLTVQITETPLVSQPNPFAEGETLNVPRTNAQISKDPGKQFSLVQQNASLSELVRGLNTLGVAPLDMIDILKAIKAAGALHAELVVM